MVNTALLAMVTKGCRRKLAAGITVNAGRVDKEIARNILWQPLKNIRHDNQSLNSNNGVMRLSIQAANRWRVKAVQAERTCQSSEAAIKIAPPGVSGTVTNFSGEY